jgi:hypothetical protein
MPDARRVQALHVACGARPDAGADSSDDRPVTFRWNSTTTYVTASPLLKSALLQLGEVWPQSLAFEDLLKVAAQRSGTPASEEAAASLRAMILEGYAKAFVLLRTRRAEFVTQVGDRPVVSPLARLQAKVGPLITNQLHELVAMDATSREVIGLLDGRHSPADVMERVGSTAAAHLDMLAKRAFLVS